jgi:hypothetical protein
MSTRCVAKTKQGKQCLRQAVPGYLFCTQHLKSQSQVSEKSPRKSPSPKKKVSSSPKKKSLSSSDEDCCVCLEKTKDRLKCKHKVCIDCTKQLHNPICPICRRDIKGDDITKDVLKTLSPPPRRRRSSGEFVWHTTTTQPTSLVRIRSESSGPEEFLRNAGIGVPTDWVAFFGIYKPIVSYHKKKFKNIPFAQWVNSMSRKDKLELLKKFYT